MTARRGPSRRSSQASQDTAASTQDAALQGATTAFGRPAQRTSAAEVGSPGAVTAASLASSPSSIANGTRVEYTNKAKGDTEERKMSREGNMEVPQHPGRQYSRSPSQQAALMAAVNMSQAVGAETTPPRRAATTKRPAAPPKPRRLSSYGGTSNRPKSDESPTDLTSIPPTTSLVTLFERKASGAEVPRAKPEPIVVKPSGDLPLKSPKPIRNKSGIANLIQAQAETESPKPTQKVASTVFEASNVRSPDLPTIKQHEPATLVDPATPMDAASPPEKPRSNVQKSPTIHGVGTPDLTSAQVIPRGRPGPDTNFLEPSRSQENRRTQGAFSPSPLRHSSTEPVPIHQVNRQMATPSIDHTSPTNSSLKSLPAQYNLLHPRRMTPQLTGDQLANAMVAGSLASSRQTSPARSMEPPPLPRRQKHHSLSLSRTPSPAKVPPMKKTLRPTQEEESNDEQDDHGIYHKGTRKVQKRIGKHPNKHHEGDRKRWRESVSERERKRYEGLWAANKGLYASLTIQEHAIVSRNPYSERSQEIREHVKEQVSNLVARDIWSRSRLPDTTLEMVWDLVDGGQTGRLAKDEFVVGLFLIDQRLRGRKLPVKVSDSLWRSVRGLQGVKIKK